MFDKYYHRAISIKRTVIGEWIYILRKLITDLVFSWPLSFLLKYHIRVSIAHLRSSFLPFNSVVLLCDEIEDRICRKRQDLSGKLFPHNDIHVSSMWSVTHVIKFTQSSAHTLSWACEAHPHERCASSE